MTPRTRTSNQSANFKVYYSKKVPQQVCFPHKKKTVRRPDSTEQDGVDKRQMKFLPKTIRPQKTNDEDELEESGVGKVSALQTVTNEDTPKSTHVHRRNGKKRESKDVQEGSETDEEVFSTSFKRQRRTTAPKTKRSSMASDSKVMEEPNRTLRLQSTMTQLADGRRPSLGTNEPEFKSLKRCSRVSWSGGGTEKERDKKQRTLTQMIPGIGCLSREELEELSHLDEDLGEYQTDGDSVSQSLAEQGLLNLDTAFQGTAPMQLRSGMGIESQTARTKDEDDLLIVAHDPSSIVVQSVEEMTSDDYEEDYQPTQFIEAPSSRVRQIPERRAKNQYSSRSVESGKSAKSRFSLLSTPEKRRVFEIPSSQSPAESILLSQTSPPNSDRSMLGERNSRVTTIVADTPSKRRQVTFREPTAQPAPPACLREFGSTIRDSEDEGESDIEDGSVGQQRLDGDDPIASSQAVGADTQTVPNQIDRASADASETLAINSCDSSEDTEESAVRRVAYEPSPELGGSWAPVIYDDDGPEYQSYRSVHSTTKSQSFRDVEAVDVNSKETPLPFDLTDHTQPEVITKGTDRPIGANVIPSMPPVVQRQTNEDLPSTPMAMRDDSSEDREVKTETILLHAVERAEPSKPPVTVHPPTDLDGEPVQVPRSPSVDRETQQSHTSGADQQLQSEWFSYTQYMNERAPNSSSMHAATDAFSYNARPQLSTTSLLTTSSTRIQHSQATTIDEVTPKKSRTKLVVSSDTTPHRISKSRPFISPDKPPSLFIPSSFPSPSRALMEGWSSPVIDRTQNLYGSSQALGSLEDFSIPPPPPIEDD